MALTTNIIYVHYIKTFLLYIKILNRTSFHDVENLCRNSFKTIPNYHLIYNYRYIGVSYHSCSLCIDGEQMYT